MRKLLSCTLLVVLFPPACLGYFCSFVFGFWTYGWQLGRAATVRTMRWLRDEGESS